MLVSLFVVLCLTFLFVFGIFTLCALDNSYYLVFLINKQMWCTDSVVWFVQLFYIFSQYPNNYTYYIQFSVEKSNVTRVVRIWNQLPVELRVFSHSKNAFRLKCSEYLSSKINSSSWASISLLNFLCFEKNSEFWEEFCFVNNSGHYFIVL